MPEHSSDKAFIGGNCTKVTLDFERSYKTTGRGVGGGGGGGGGGVAALALFSISVFKPCCT